MGSLSKDWMAEQKPLARVVDLVSLGVLFGPGAPDPDLDRFQIRVWDTGRN